MSATSVITGQPGCALPFFLQAAPGQRFCLLHAPPNAQPGRGAIVYVHPFAEEMNKSRRMAALQARALAKLGFWVLQIDLYGCGDSSGEFGAARWAIWKNDLALACDWLMQQTALPLTLWGLRLGALLALDFAFDASFAIERLLLWQTVINGKTYMSQFLRLQLASQMLGDDATENGGGAGAMGALRRDLAAGIAVEVAGYMLGPELVAQIEQRDAASLAPHCPAHWFELTPAASLELPPATRQLAKSWRGADLQWHALPAAPGAQFWSSIEIMESQALLSATCKAFS